MRIKDNLLVREVAGTYVIVPVGKRIQEIPGVVYMNRMGYFIWYHITGKDFEPEEIFALLSKKYPNIHDDQIRKDIDEFLQDLIENHMIDTGNQSGWNYARFPDNYKKDIEE